MNYTWLESIFSPGGFKTLSQEQRKKQHEKHQVEEESTDANDADQNRQAAYACPHDGCVRVFQRLGNLENHLTSDKCTRALEKHTLLDLAKMGYKSSLEEGVGVVPTLQASKSLEKSSTSRLAEGWALRASKKAYRFSEKQKEYLMAKFEIGQSTGRKVDANIAAQDMRRVRGSDGERLFQASEFLSPQQIASYFSRLAAKRRKEAPTESDLTAIEEEINFTRARNRTLESIGLQHPIVYGQHNICAMVEKKTLKSLKLGMLQVMCRESRSSSSKKARKSKSAIFKAAE